MMIDNKKEQERAELHAVLNAEIAEISKIEGLT